MNARVLGISFSVVLAATAIACSGATRRSGFESETDPVEAKDGGGGLQFAEVDAGPGNPCAVNNLHDDPDKDSDGDGYPLKLDCNECDPNVNAGALDVADNGLDEDCDGTPDNNVAECDDQLAIDPVDPFNAAKALGLCKKADPNGRDWGVVSARYIRPDGTPATPDLDVGVLTKFGVNAPQAGKSMLVLSSGYARAPGDPGFSSGTGRTKGDYHAAPPGYPKEFAGCPAAVITGEPQDGIGLEVIIRAPSNAKSLRYQQNFFTYEYSAFICTQWNDFFVTMMDPKPAGLTDGNIAFDSQSNPISVNNGLLQVCSPGTFKGKAFSCPLGTSTLDQTGFEGHAATGWLTTTAAVEPGQQITLRFAIWDSGDGAYDSTVLLDDFVFDAAPADGAVTRPSLPK